MNHKEFSIWLEGFLCNKTVLQTDEILIIREKLSKIKEENIPYNIENFRDQLTKLAESVEILENTFLNDGIIEIKVSLEEDTFLDLMKNLNNKINDNKIVVSIGNVDFTFLKK